MLLLGTLLTKYSQKIIIRQKSKIQYLKLIENNTATRTNIM